MGRRKKFRIGEVVTYRGRPAVVVDYRQDAKGRGFYRVVRLVSLPSGRGYGPAVWRESYRLSERKDWSDGRPTAVKQYRANQKLGAERGCSCECCAHVAIPVGVIRNDGTLKGEEA